RCLISNLKSHLPQSPKLPLKRAAIAHLGDQCRRDFKLLIRHLRFPIRRIPTKSHNSRLTFDKEGPPCKEEFMRINKWLGLLIAPFILVPATSAFAQGIVVQVRPPHAVVEHRGHAPGPGYVWVPGYQRWDGSRYAWVPGQWQQPPRTHARWVPY